MASEDEARGIGLNWASEGLEIVHNSVVDFAWRVGGFRVSIGERVEGGTEMEERREEDEAGEVVEGVRRRWAKERRVVRRREDVQKR